MLADPGRLRRLALAVKAGAGEFYGLEWESVLESDEIGVAPRVLLGGEFRTRLRMGVYSPDLAPKVQLLADYLAALTPDTILELLDHAE